MIRNRWIDRICVAGILLSIVITILFMNGTALGLATMIDEDSDSGEDTGHFTENDLDGAWDVSLAVPITLEGDNGVISGNGAYFLDGDLVIALPGRYVLTGSLEDGSIIVDYEQDAKTWIMLDGVDISCSDDACLRVDDADKVFLTLAEGSENTLKSGETYSEEALADGTGGVIYSHDDLTINGSGSLTIDASYKHGIESNDDLVITGGTIDITCVQDAMHVNDSLKITDASITVNAGDDALHGDTEIYIAGGTILLESCYEGIEAPAVTIDGGDITIYPADDGINANGGDTSFGFGNMGEAPAAQGPAAMESEAQGMAPAGMESEAQGMAPAGMESEAQADSAHATETETQEDEVQPTITINDGSITVINETGMDADGLDSNGDIIINGGTVFVSLNGTSVNNGLDYGSENGGKCLINGGTVIACAGSSMLEEMSGESGQCTLVYLPEETADANSTLTVTDASGETILTKEIPLTFSSLILSTPEFGQGQTYELNISSSDEDAVTESITFDEMVLSVNTSGGMDFGGEGQMPGPWNMPESEAMTEGGASQSKQTPDFENMTEGEFPQPGQTPNFENMTEGEFPQPGRMPDFENMTEGDGNSMMEAFRNGQGDNASESNESSSEAQTTISDYDAETWIWMAVCILALIGGILFVRRY